ncbi:MAG: HopJ type III effector protein [Proteobacteria bacterium]|nr:HopJ type III effector protein [Pseudomonadota bacterium]
MDLENFLEKLDTNPETIEFDETMTVIDSNYVYTPTTFQNGGQHNNAGENEGSCKIFAFAKLHNLTREQTLHCFGKYYRDDVLGNPEGESHQNIRQFIKSGWDGIKFNDAPLS